MVVRASEVSTIEELEAAWQTWREGNPEGGGRPRDIAETLGVGEAQLIAAGLGQGEVVKLRPEFKAIFEALEDNGEYMVSTRNEHAVIEKHGVYRGVEIGEQMGLVLDKEIDLRLFMGHFASAFAITKTHQGKVLKSIQFFDRHGDSVHKVYAKKQDSQQRLDAIVERFRAEDQRRWLPSEPLDVPEPERPDEEIDVEGLQQAWRSLKDTHEFFGLLRKFTVTRTQALRLAPPELVARVEGEGAEIARRMFEQSAEQEVSIMVFVGSRGCIEIHTGPVKKIVEMGKWLNVLDPRFNLHLDTSGIDQVWCVRKPTEDGVVTSLEFFDEQGATVAMCFGERKPGVPELESWRSLVEGVAGMAPLG